MSAATNFLMLCIRCAALSRWFRDGAHTKTVNNEEQVSCEELFFSGNLSDEGSSDLLTAFTQDDHELPRFEAVAYTVAYWSAREEPVGYRAAIKALWRYLGKNGVRP